MADIIIFFCSATCLKIKHGNKEKSSNIWLQQLKHFWTKQLFFITFHLLVMWQHTSFLNKKSHHTCVKLGFHCAAFNIPVWINFYFFLHTFFFTFPSQKQPMFSLLFNHLLGELGHMKPYKHTHASTRVYFDSWTHWTLMCDQPASPALSQKFSWKTTWISKTS